MTDGLILGRDCPGGETASLGTKRETKGEEMANDTAQFDGRGDEMTK